MLELYYGNQLTLRDIGGILGVTESRVCQLHSDAISRLRARCREDERAERASAAPRSLPPARRPARTVPAPYRDDVPSCSAA